MLREDRLGEENMLPELDKKIYTCLEGKTGRILLRGSVLEFGWRLLWRGARGCRGPDSSDNESRLSVDWPFTIRLVCMRFCLVSVFPDMLLDFLCLSEMGREMPREMLARTCAQPSFKSIRGFSEIHV